MEAKKERTVNFGITEELRDFLDGFLEMSLKQGEELKDEKPGSEAKRAIAEMVKKETEKIETELSNGVSDERWSELMKKAHTLSELVRWY